MLVTVLDTRELAGPDRFAAFNEAAGVSVAPTVNRSDHEDDFRAAVRVADLRTAQLSTLVVPAVQARRTPALIRRSDPETYHVALVTGGRHCLEQAGRQVSAGKGDLLLYDTSRPYVIHTHDDDEPAACIIAQVPRTALGLRYRQVDPILAVPLAGTAGIGGLLAQFLTGVVTASGALGPSDAPNLAAVLTDLVAALAAHELGLSSPPLPPPPRQALFLQIQADMQAHLSDPGLSPSAIAAAHQISVRYLHKLFEDQETTVSAWIRRQRLTQARRDLTDPALRDQPVHAIAARWGFTHASQFNRAFRAAYGCPPSQCRPERRSRA